MDEILLRFYESIGSKFKVTYPKKGGCMEEMNLVLRDGHELTFQPSSKIIGNAFSVSIEVAIWCPEGRSFSRNLSCPSLEFCPACDKPFDSEEISGHFLKKNLETYLQDRNGGLQFTLHNKLGFEVVMMSDSHIKSIINCLAFDPKLRGEKLLSEIGCPQSH